MRRLRKLGFFVLAVLVTAGLATAQSLAEVAKKEKKRREANHAEAKTVITDRDLTTNYGGLPAARSRTAPSEAEESGEEASADEGAAGDEAEAEDETKKKEYWVARVKAAKEKIKRLEERLANEDWGEGQRFGVDPRGLNNLTSRQKTEQELAAARAELEAIRAEARRAGAPPGWTR